MSSEKSDGGGKPLLEVNAVSVRFGGIVALDAVSFTVAAGQIFGILREIATRGTLVAVATHAEDWVRRYPGRAIRLERGMVRSDRREGEG